MKQTLFFLALSLMIMSCGDQKKKAASEVQSENNSTAISKVGRNNFAVIWKWTTNDEQLVSDKMTKISEELTNLWKEGIVENVYYNTDSKEEKLAIFPNISFFIKAESLEAAKLVLNGLTVVKNGIALYSIHPVGNLWLDRRHEIIHENGMTKSFVTVWKTNNKPTEDLTKNQNDAVLSLWNKGKIENVYFDIEGTQKANIVTDFVFYANVNTEEEAIELCESLPFSKNNISTFEVHEVGVFWMGNYSQK